MWLTPRAMRALAIACLAATLATPIAVTWALWSAPVRAAAGQECCPSAGPGHVCPMHHANSGTHACRVIGSCHSDAALLSLVVSTGVLTARTQPSALPNVIDRRVPAQSTPLARADTPDPPPPRS